MNEYSLEKYREKLSKIPRINTEKVLIELNLFIDVLTNGLCEEVIDMFIEALLNNVEFLE